MMPYEIDLPRCRMFHKLLTGEIVRCAHAAKYAGDTRCEDCFVNAQIPALYKSKTIRQKGRIRIIKITRRG